MIRSIFTNPPWGRYDMARLSGPWPHPELSEYSLGQEAVYSLRDFLERALKREEIEKIADPAVREEFKREYDACEAKGLLTTEGAQCLLALGLKVYQKLEEEAKTPPTPTPTVRPTGQPPEAGFPYIPVAIAAVAGGALIYLLTKA